MTDRATRKVPYALIVSVLINMALIGLVAGLFLRPGHGPMAPRERPWAAMKPSEDDERAIRRVIVSGLRDARTEIATRKTAQQALIGAFNADPYDPDAVKSAISAFRTADNAARDAIATSIASEIDTLTPEQRQMTARLLVAGVEGGRGRRGGRFERGLPPEPPQP